MPSAPLFKATGERSGEFDLPVSVWGEKLRVDLVHQAVETELWNRRQGTAKTKDRSEVRGGGKKPYRQKGTGRARQGSTRAPHFRHGGVVHGPETRDYHKKMPQKMRRLAFCSALSAKATDGGVRVLETLAVGEISTKSFATWLGKFETGKKTVLVLSARDENAILSARNLPNVKVIVLPGLSTRQVVEAETLILTKEAVETLEKLYAGPAAAAAAPAVEPAKPKARAKKAEEPVAAAAPAEEAAPAPKTRAKAKAAEAEEAPAAETPAAKGAPAAETPAAETAEAAEGSEE
jgi:large subunit ribosomal protein L4